MKNTILKISAKASFLAWILYSLFIIYGSLIPFRYTEMSIVEALQIFSNIPYLNLGMQSRQDLIANCLLYIPMSYLGCLWLSNFRIYRLITVMTVSAFSVILIISIEFAQVFFNRTVSLNDILLEIIGSILGIILFFTVRKPLRLIVSKLTMDFETLFQYALVFYALVLFVYLIFPFDFVLSFNELKQNIGSGKVAILWIENKSYLRVFYSHAANFLFFIPIGFSINLLLKVKLSNLKILSYSLAIGFFFETIQLFLISGVSQGIAIILKALGIYSGYKLGSRWSLASIIKYVTEQMNQKNVSFVFMLYFIVLIFFNWGGKGNFLTVNRAMAKLSELSFLPFYYHYFMSESNALLSTLVYFILFIPLGCLYSLKKNNQIVRPMNFFIIILISMISAFILESGKLFFLNARPDITNLIICTSGSFLGFKFFEWIKFISKEQPNDYSK